MADQSAPDRAYRYRLPRWMRVGRVLLIAGLLAGALTYRITQNDYTLQNPLPDGLNVRVWRISIQASALRDGLQLLGLWSPYTPQRWVEAHLSRRSHIGNRGRYPHAIVLSFCGLNVACNPREYNGGDYIISPFLALDLPYWLLISGSALMMFWWSAPPALLSAWSLCRSLSPLPWFVMALVAVGFFLLNWWARIDPYNSEQSVWTLMVAPSTYNYGVLYLEYGWPSVCLSRIWDHGVPAPNGFQGYDTLGWRPARLAENVLVAISVTLLCGMSIEWLRRRSQKTQ